MIFYDESAAAVVGIAIPPHPAMTKKKLTAHAILRSWLDTICYTDNSTLAHVAQTVARI
jgi:hypothetical protein